MVRVFINARIFKTLAHSAFQVPTSRSIITKSKEKFFLYREFNKMSKFLIAICVSLAVIANGASAKYLRTVPTCKDGSHHFLPSPDECRSFYVCYLGRAVRQSCPGDLLWDRKLNVCNYASQVQCNDGPVDPVTQPPAPVTEAPVPVTTKAPVPVTEAPVPVTEAPVPVTTKAPAPVTEAPVPVTTKAPAPVTDTPAVPPPQSGDLPCPPDAFTYVAYPSDCSRFYLCKAGVFQGVYNCGAGLLFTTTPLQACVRPEKSNCQA